MPKTKNKAESLQLLTISDLGGLALSVWFVFSVISNARDLLEQNIKNAPATYGLILALLLIGYGLLIRKKLNFWGIVSLTILATATTIWLFGLSGGQRYEILPL